MRKILVVILAFAITAATFNSAAAKGLPASASVKGFVGHPQSYVLSCESRSAVDWAAYWGVEISETEFLTRLPRSDNPDAGFVGNPNHAWGNIPPNSYGVHAKPVAGLLRQLGLQAKARSDMSWRELRIEIAAGRPVIVWVIGGMISGYPISYTAQDGHNTIVANYEHTMVIVGYGPDYVQAVDAYTGLTQTYSREVFMASWGVLGRMAVSGDSESKPAKEKPKTETTSENIVMTLRLPVVFRHTSRTEQPTTATRPPKTKPERIETYIVQPGDYLIALANQFNLDWYSLVVLNDLQYPWVIYPGQILRLR